MLAAIVFLACRHTGNARTFKEICAVVPQASVKVGLPALLLEACRGCYHSGRWLAVGCKVE